MKFRLGCELTYKVKTETVFIFNVEVAFLRRHGNLTDRLVLEPKFPRRSYAVPDLKNRYMQTVVPPGTFTLSYSAELDLKRRSRRSRDGSRNSR